jgi:hypothetical protein
MPSPLFVFGLVCGPPIIHEIARSHGPAVDLLDFGIGLKLNRAYSAD